jgi:hypothetical protein
MKATLTHQVMDERRECGEPHARARARLAGAGRGGAKGASARYVREWSAETWPGRGGAGRGGAKGAGAGARHAREWSAEIRPLALRGRGYLLPFDFLVSWLLRLS